MLIVGPTPSATLTRELETTWWGSRDGDGIVDLPLQVERIYVEARNEVPYLSQMTIVPDRSIRLAGLAAEYADEAHASPAILTRYALRRPTPQWEGPMRNPIADLPEHGAWPAPEIKGFEEPHHWADGRRMIIHFDAQEDVTYQLYLSLYENGRGAELITHPRIPLEPDSVVRGLKPDTPLYLFLTYIKDGRESKPSPVYPLVTRDNFAEK